MLNIIIKKGKNKKNISNNNNKNHCFGISKVSKKYRAKNWICVNGVVMTRFSHVSDVATDKSLNTTDWVVKNLHTFNSFQTILK